MDIRDLFFGDLPADRWPEQSSTEEVSSEPWTSFVKSRQFSVDGDNERAKQCLHEILSMNHLESRHYLQAWNFLRTLGEQPPADEAKHLYGVVIEVALDEGVDVVAAYEDHTARYINHSGAGVVWEHPSDSLNELIDDLLNEGRRIVEKIGPWEGPRPPSPPTGQARISMLVPLGLHFGQASYEILSRDHTGGPALNAGFKLMQGLTEATVSADKLPR
jgi:hypothetical protein